MAISSQDEPTQLTAPKAQVELQGTAPVAAVGESSWGRYVIIEAAGAGAMGTVARAFDPKLHREVALKRLRPTVLGQHGEARLIREARAMAQLNHRHVVSVYDVEAGDEGVTLVMEYVPGKTLRQWLTSEPPWPEILATFIRAGEGLAAAHEAGLVHRDFKPSNVLVSEDDDGNVVAVKVTDFGLARALARTDPEDAMRSSPGVESADPDALTHEDILVGTPRYMAPEQYDEGVPDATADQYAFCVALWEALHGDPPFLGRGGALLKAKEGGPPPWPKASPVPRHIAAAIVRGLAPKPQGRWPGIRDLLQRLAYDPRRRRRQLAFGIAVASIATAWSVGAYALSSGADDPCSGGEEAIAEVWGADRRAAVLAAFKRSALPTAAAVAERIGPALDRYAGDWVAERRLACEATRVHGEQPTAVMNLRMRCLEVARRDWAAAVELLAKGDDSVVLNAVGLVEDLPGVAQCANVEALSGRGALPDDAETAREIDEVRELLAGPRALTHGGHYGDAIEALEPLIARADATGYPPLRAEAQLLFGSALIKGGRYEAARDALRQAVSLALESERMDVAAEAAQRLLFVVGYRLRKLEEARSLEAVALGLARQIDPGGEAEAEVLGSIGSSRSAANDLDSAIAYHEQSIELKRKVGSSDRDLALALSNYGNALVRAGRFREAKTVLAESIELWGKAVGPDHPEVATAINNLGNAHAQLREDAEAEAAFRRALLLRERNLPEIHPDIADARNNTAMFLYTVGKHEEALEMVRGALEIWKKTLGETDPSIVRGYLNMGLALSTLGRKEEAEAAYKAAVELCEKHFGPEDPDLAKALNSFAGALYTWGRHDEALVKFQRAAEILEKAYGPDHPELGAALLGVGNALLKAGRVEEARRVAERAERVVRSAYGDDHEKVRNAEELLRLTGAE